MAASDHESGVLKVPSVAGSDGVGWGFQDVGRAGAERMRRRRRVGVDGAGEGIDVGGLVYVLHD